MLVFAFSAFFAVKKICYLCVLCGLCGKDVLFLPAAPWRRRSRNGLRQVELNPESPVCSLTPKSVAKMLSGDDLDRPYVRPRRRNQCGRE